MNIHQRRYWGLAACAAAAWTAGCDYPPRRYQSAAVRTRWSDWSNRSLDLMVDRYGRPTRIESKRVVWENKGVWKRIAVWDEMGYLERTFGPDNIEQTISYMVPESRRIAVEDLSGRVKVSEDGTELSARSSSEELNYLALNLADEIINGAKKPDEARRFYAETARLANAGKTSPYMEGLLFTAPR